MSDSVPLVLLFLGSCIKIPYIPLTFKDLVYRFSGQNVYYSNGVFIYITNYTTPDGQNTFYQDTFASVITDLDVAGDYVYYVGSNNL